MNLWGLLLVHPDGVQMQKCAADEAYSWSCWWFQASGSAVLVAVGGDNSDTAIDAGESGETNADVDDIFDSDSGAVAKTDSFVSFGMIKKYTLVVGFMKRM